MAHAVRHGAVTPKLSPVAKLSMLLRCTSVGSTSSLITRSLLLGLGLAMASPVASQTTGPVGGRSEIFVGSELENYLRLLQLAGKSPLYPWSIRGFSPREVDRLLPDSTDHPWGGRYQLAADTMRGLRTDWVRPSARLIYNSAFPYGFNDGPVWAGRGMTTVLQGGFSARLGPASLVVAPVLFRAENRAFPLQANGRGGAIAFADGRHMDFIDLPQRFGAEAYQRIDPGQSTLRLDLGPVAAGLSTANQQWGPAWENPIILGANAAGFPHGFVGTSRPADLWLGKVHGRVVYGSLGQTDYSVVRGHGTRRFMSGFVGVVTPRWLPGLELGASRFFHTPWPKGGLTRAHLEKPLDGLLKKHLVDRDTVGSDTKQDVDNQLASVFARWALPGSGFEVYGEFARDDHNWNTRDLILLPDHQSAYTVGLQKVWLRADDQWVTLRAEVLNAGRSHLLRVRNEAPFGVHGFTRQGHTQRGQMLGSAAEFGGGGSLLAGEYHHRGGRWQLAWRRLLRGENDAYLERKIIDPRGVDAVQALSADGVLFVGPVDLHVGATAAYNLNRNFQRDVLNWNLLLGGRMGF